jgi:hypothetical protein
LLRKKEWDENSLIKHFLHTQSIAGDIIQIALSHRQT